MLQQGLSKKDIRQLPYRDVPALICQMNSCQRANRPPTYYHGMQHLHVCILRASVLRRQVAKSPGAAQLFLSWECCKQALALSGSFQRESHLRSLKAD